MKSSVNSNKESQPPSWSQTAKFQKPSFQIIMKLLRRWAYKKERIHLSCFKPYPTFLTHCISLHLTLLCWSLSSGRQRVLSDLVDWDKKQSWLLHQQDAVFNCLPTPSLPLQRYSSGPYAYWLFFLSAGEGRKQTPGKPFSMSGWEFCFQSCSRSLNKGLWWAVTLHPQQWIKLLLRTDKLLEITTMTQPSLEDWTFHAQTNIIKKKNL